MSKRNKADSIEKEKRIHEVSLLLRHKSVKYIIQYITKEYDIKIDQAYNYIALAKQEWKRYFENVKQCGMNWHITQVRDLKSKIMDKDKLNKDDMRLMFDIFKEESKLMGVYPATQFEVTEKKVVVIGRKDKKDDDKKECKKQ